MVLSDLILMTIFVISQDFKIQIKVKDINLIFNNYLSTFSKIF